jgi:uncharacterized protein (DUF1697 family)
LPSEKYIAILRGINVGGHRLIKMDALHILLQKLGCTNTQSYIQSGNFVFQATKLKDNAILAKQISDAILNQFSFEVPVLVLNARELDELITNNPFLADKHKDALHLHATIFNEAPDAAHLKFFQKDNYLPDEFAFDTHAVYLYCPNGYSKCKLTNGYLENKLKVNATTRNWKTLITLQAMASTI